MAHFPYGTVTNKYRWLAPLPITFKITIFQVDSCNRFWFQPKCVEAQVEKIHQELNSAHRSRCIRPIDVNVPIKLSQIVAVKTDDVVYRGKVINIKRDRRSASHIYQVGTRIPNTCVLT